MILFVFSGVFLFQNKTRAFLIKKQSFKKLTVILRVTGKLLLKSKDMCLNEIFELTILMLTFCKNGFLKDI
jgi:hypothetical protein